jgi:hypothetical protein
MGGKDRTILAVSTQAQQGEKERERERERESVLMRITV